MNEKHFELTENFKINIFWIKLFQIKCTKKILFAEVGDLGGWIESEKNISGDAWVYGDAQVYGNADYCCFQSFGSTNRITTVFREESNKLKIVCGCFSGTLEEFTEQVKETHGDNKFSKEYFAIIEVIKILFEL